MTSVKSDASKKILVVDDDPNIVRVIQNRLEANQYLVVTAHDGLVALEKVKSEKPDLILLDIMMPRMDGSMFLQQMKKEGLLGTIPVIVLTAKANMREFFLIDGVVEFIVKPFEAKNLLGQIASSLTSKRTASTQSTTA